VQSESTRWLYALVALVAVSGWWQGVVALAIATAAALAIWFGWVRRDVGRRIRNRVETQALDDASLWRKLWRHGGVRLVPRDGDPCAAPRDNWMQFVRDRFPAAES
jgi:O-antigen/teichoic acid export membrane protein